MSGEDFAGLRKAMELARDEIRLLEWAIQNIEAVAAQPESETADFLARYDLVCAFWHDGNQIMCRNIKGLLSDERAVMANAIAVRDEAEARRWAAMLSAPTGSVQPTTRSLRLAAVDGATLIP